MGVGTGVERPDGNVSWGGRSRVTLRRKMTVIDVIQEIDDGREPQPAPGTGPPASQGFLHSSLPMLCSLQ